MSKSLNHILTSTKRLTKKNTNGKTINKLLQNIEITNKHINTNPPKQFNLYKAKTYKVMFHLTSKINAESILNNGFDITKSKLGAFGYGINLSTDINHLKHYYEQNKSDYLIICNVKFNKKKVNSTELNNNGNMKWILNSEGEKLHTKPIYSKVPKGYDALYVKGPEIYVIPNSEQVYPIMICKITNW